MVPTQTIANQSKRCTLLMHGINVDPHKKTLKNGYLHEGFYYYTDKFVLSFQTRRNRIMCNQCFLV
jgi:hypothetical protein